MFNYSVRIKTGEDIVFPDSFGVTNLETDDPLFGEPLSEISPSRVEDIRDMLITSRKKIVLHTVRMKHDRICEYERALKNALRLGIENVKVCLGSFDGAAEEKGTKEIISMASCLGINVLFEPRKIYPFFTDEFYGKIRSENTGIIFNPAEYAAMGKGAFLGVLYKYKYKDDIRFLRIDDAKFDGTPTPLEKGNAEIKECVSALLARNFDGYFSFRKYADGIPLADVFDSFANMMKNL